MKFFCSNVEKKLKKITIQRGKKKRQTKSSYETAHKGGRVFAEKWRRKRGVRERKSDIFKKEQQKKVLKSQ